MALAPSPCIGGNGCYAIALRVDRATPDTIFKAAMNLLEATGDAAFSIPAPTFLVWDLMTLLPPQVSKM